MLPAAAARADSAKLEDALEKGSGHSSAASAPGGACAGPAPPPAPAQPPAAGAAASSKSVIGAARAAAASGTVKGVVGATAHIVTAVVGSGVLALPYSVAVLGWAAGPLLIVLCAALTLYTSLLLADLYGARGRIHRTYSSCVKEMYGRWGFHACAWVQHISLILYGVAYTVTGAQAMQSVTQSICDAHGHTSCGFTAFWQWALVFGCIQLVLGQLPSLHYFYAASVIGAAMSVGYSTTAVGISAGNLDGTYGHGTAGGLAFGSSADKAWEALNALGAILFSFNISLILIEVQDTLRHPAATSAAYPRQDAVAMLAREPIRQMRAAIYISVALMTGLYLAVACFGYAALGEATSYNILFGPFGTGWPASEVPRWVIIMANLMVFVRTVPAYQIYSIPFLCFVEEELEATRWWPRWLLGLRLRLVWRSFYVVAITCCSIVMPFFQVVVGFIGAFCFFPIVIFFPIEMWIKTKRPRGAKLRWLRALNVAGLLVTLATTAGSLQLLITSWSDFQLFGSNVQTTGTLT